MSNPYLAVEKVTESLVGNTKVKLSLGLAASDKRRVGVARSVGPLLAYLPCVQQELRPLFVFVPKRRSFL